MNTCTVDNCAQKVIARGWRSTHYGRWRRNGDPTIAHREVTCAQCGKRFTTNTAGARAYCTDLCLVEARNSRRSTAKAARRSATTKACALCGTTFSPARSMKQKYCTAKCTASASRDASGKTCTVDDCARPVRARGMCSMHYKRWARAEGLLKPEPWDDRRKNNHHLRRARMIGNGPYEMVTIDALMARDQIVGKSFAWALISKSSARIAGILS